MIICKIAANYDDTSADFNQLYNKLASMGGVLFSHNHLFFGSDAENVTSRKIKNLFHRCGYKDLFIEEYNEKHMPNEDHVVNNWIIGWQAKLTVKQLEVDHQAQLQGQYDQLMKLESQLDKIDKEHEQKMRDQKKEGDHGKEGN